MHSFIVETAIVTASLLTLVKIADTFNLEPRLPLVKSGFKDSYFGYSVAQHIIPSTQRKAEEPVLLIGAPRADSGQPFTNRSGLVYRCKLTSDRKDCTALFIDQTEKAPDPGISKDDQWMGVTVKSKGARGHVIACAHRYVTKGLDYRWGLGICYSLSAFLDLEHPWEPCLNRPTGKAHEEFGFCQVGTSGEICEDNTILLGAPGPYTWRGTIFSNSVKFSLRDDKRWYMSPVRDSESPVDKYSYLGMSVASGRFFTNKLDFASGAPRSNGTGQVIFFTKDTLNPQFNAILTLNGEQFASSFGYTILAVDVNGDKRTDFFAAAPFYYSDNEGGAVYFYKNNGAGFDHVPTLKLTGKPESRFGFALADVGDLNQDGYNDIAIGAPYEDSGAIYIYLGSPNGIKAQPSQVLRASDLPGDAKITQTFGYSLSGGADMDGNGYPDLLIGAYANDAAILVRSRPILNITTRVRGDYHRIDPNSQGCPEDRYSKLTCFSFEACFRFTSEASTYSLPLKLHYRIEAETFTGKKYFRVKFNSSAEGDSQNIITRNITFKKGFDLREEKCSKEIVYVKDKTDILNPIKFQLTYSLIQTLPTRSSLFDSIPNMGDYPILNQEEAHKVFETHFLKECGTNEVCESDLRLTANLDLQKASDRERYILYLGKGDVSLNITVTNDHESAYDANIFISHPESLNFRVTKKIIGEQVECIPLNASLLRCELGNPFKAKQIAEFQIRFTPKEILGDLSMIDIDVFVNTTSNDTTPQFNEVKLTAIVVGLAELEIKGSTDQENVLYGGEVKGESAMVTEEDVGSLVTQSYVIYNKGPWRAKTVEVVISWPYEVENKKKHGKWIFYLMETPIVQDDGYCILADHMVNPLKLKVVRPPLRPKPSIKTRPYTEQSSSTTQTSVTNEAEDDIETKSNQNLTPVKVETTEIYNKRTEKITSKTLYTETKSTQNLYEQSKVKVKREVVVLPEQIKEEGKVQNIVTLDCKRRTARCYQFSCFINNLRPHHSAAIKIRARLWNSTFIEDYAFGVNQVHIISHARLKKAKGQPDVKFEDEIASVKTKAHPDLPLLPPQKAPLWIIILAVILGIILLLILIFCLWKIGFFKRKNPRSGYMPADTDEKEINYS